VLVRHASEIPRLTNTGLWAALALRGSEVRDHGLQGSPLDLEDLAAPGTVLLFPSPHPPDPAATRPRRLVVPDGTWSQARRMVQRIPALRTMPRLTLPALVAPPDAARLRRPTIAGGMSTIEAIAAALRFLGEPEPARQLEALHEAGRERAMRLRGTWTEALS
jgi:DTW domain-containing protein YfiP